MFMLLNAREILVHSIINVNNLWLLFVCRNDDVPAEFAAAGRVARLAAGRRSVLRRQRARPLLALQTLAQS